MTCFCQEPVSFKRFTRQFADKLIRNQSIRRLTTHMRLFANCSHVLTQNVTKNWGLTITLNTTF